jgi:Rrf2 family protein
LFITRECDYAIRVVRALSDSEKKPVNVICEEEHVPVYFAYKILKKLEKAKLVRSIRGSIGGYQLAKDLNKITILEIVSAIDSELFLNACLKDGFDCPRNPEGDCCKVHIELDRIQERLAKMLEEKTMDEFCEIK